MKISHSEKHKAILLGAFDRFNYGDLLFPIIVRNELSTHTPNTHTAVHALVDSDLARYGALKTQSLKALFQPGALTENDVVIFAGGGTIGVDWTYMYANLLGKNGNATLHYLKRIFGEKAINAISRRRFSAQAPFPWVAGPEDFPVHVKVAYNAVGGSEFQQLNTTVQNKTLDRLGKATYLSVRDYETKRLFSPLEHSLPVVLAPDSAILMSEQFPVSWLETQTSAQLRETIDSGPYICFQANLNYVRKNSDSITSVLESIHQEYGLRALLLPIGRYVGLDDQFALRTIREKLRTPAEVISDQASIFEIMLTIAKAKLFLGTSLHGNVTSQSFAVPHLGLSDRPCKVDFYLGTWDLPEQQRCVQLRDVTVRAGRALAIPDEVRQMKRRVLIDLSHENFRKMALACGLDWLIA